ncbi:hypothetical protein DRQ09_04730, partial [candidate division KSB1 bacterium]
MKKSLFISFIILLFLNTSATAQRNINRALNSITKKDLHAHLYFLASDELKGRGTPGQWLDISAKYLASEFEKAGLKVAGENGSYLQKYNLNIYNTTPKNTEVRIDVMKKKFKPGKKDMFLLLFGITQKKLDFSAPIIFAGYGITSPEHKWDDYSGIDVKGKVVLVLEGAPWEVDLNVPFGYDKLLGKWINAAVHGAIGFIYATPKFGKDEPQSVSFTRAIAGHRSIVRPTEDEKVKLSVPVVVTSFNFIDKVLKKAGKDKAEILYQKMKSTNKSVSFDLENTTFSLKVKVKPEIKTAYNVIGILEGRDPVLKKEYVVLSAHFDHEGVGEPVDGDDIYNGADDNASGTAGILEVAYAYNFLTRRERPRRSILFLLVSGEELLLFGSGYFSEHPTVSYDKIVADLNVDMIGRSPDNSVQIIAPGQNILEKIIKNSNRKIKLNILPDKQPEMRLIYLSDHYHFARAGKPIAFFFTGLHPDYHTPKDEIDRINFNTMEKIVKLLFLSSYNIANYRGKF